MGHQNQIVYFPHINMTNIPEINLGNVKIWNFSQKKDAYIPDTDMKEKVRKILLTHTYQGKSIIDSICIISIGDIDFRTYNEDENKLIKSIRYLLFLAFVAKNNTRINDANSGHWMATSENFDVVFQNFILNDDHVAERTGDIVTFLKGGYLLDSVHFERPGYVPTPMKFDLDDDIINGLLALKDKSISAFERIMDATEIFYESYYNSPSVSKNARVLLQVSAFEILLNFPDNDQRKYFKAVVRRLLVNKGDPKRIHYSERGVGKPKVREVISLKEMWADSFYTLRNHIIHGQPTTENDFIFKNSQYYTDISVLFFIYFIKKSIEQNIRGYSCNVSIEWESWKDDISQPTAITRKGFVYGLSTRKLFERLLKSGKR